MNIQKTLFSFVFVVLTFNINNQLISKDLEQQPTKFKVDSLYNVGWEYLNANPDSSVYYSGIQKKWALDINYELGQVNADYLLGLSYARKLYFDLAAMNLFDGLQITQNKKSSDFMRKRLFILQSLGAIYYETYQYDNSLKYYIQAISIAKKLGYQKTLGELYYNIAIDHWKKEDHELTNDYIQKSLKSSRIVNDKFTIARIYNFLGSLYNKKGEYDLAKENYLKSLKVSDGVQSLKQEILMFKINLAENYYKQGHLAQAKGIYLESLDSCKYFNDTKKLKWIYNNLGDVYLHEHNLDMAISYYKKSIELKVSEISDEKAQYAYKRISEIYEKLGQYKIALEYKSEYLKEADKVLALKENLSEQNAQYRMKEVDWQREMMQKQEQLAKSEKENLWGRIIIGTALLLIIICARLIYVYYRKIYMARKIVNSYSVEYLDF